MWMRLTILYISGGNTRKCYLSFIDTHFLLTSVKFVSSSDENRNVIPPVLQPFLICVTVFLVFHRDLVWLFGMSLVPWFPLLGNSSVQVSFPTDFELHQLRRNLDSRVQPFSFYFYDYRLIFFSSPFWSCQHLLIVSRVLKTHWQRKKFKETVCKHVTVFERFTIIIWVPHHVSHHRLDNMRDLGQSLFK